MIINLNQNNLRSEAKLLIDEDIGNPLSCISKDIDFKNLTDEIIFNYPMSTFTFNPSTVSVITTDGVAFKEKYQKVIKESIIELLKSKKEYLEMFNAINTKNLYITLAINKYTVIYPYFKCNNNSYFILNTLPNSIKELYIDPDTNAYDINVDSLKLFETIILAYYSYFAKQIYDKIKYDIDYLSIHKKIFDRILFEREKIVLDQKVYNTALITYLTSPTVSSTKINIDKIKSIFNIKEEPLKQRTWSAILNYIHNNGYKYNILTIKTYLYKHSIYLPILLSSIKGVILLYAGTKHRIPLFRVKEYSDLLNQFKFEQYI